MMNNLMKEVHHIQASKVAVMKAHPVVIRLNKVKIIKNNQKKRSNICCLKQSLNSS